MVKLLESLGIWLITLMLQGFVLSRLWEWFIVTKFNAPRLNVYEAIGVSLVSGALLLSAVTVTGQESSLLTALNFCLAELVIWGTGKLLHSQIQNQKASLPPTAGLPPSGPNIQNNP